MDESRRSLIKKAAVGAGLVWASPVIQSVTSPAYGQAGTPQPTTTSTTTPGEPILRPCFTPSSCPDIVFCPDGAPCVCADTVDGGAFCIDGSTPFCVDGQCPPGQVCITNEFGSFCGPPICSDQTDCPPSSLCTTGLCSPFSHCFPLGGCNHDPRPFFHQSGDGTPILFGAESRR